MFAVIEMQGHQYIVSEGTELVVDWMGEDHKDGAKITIDTVLATFNEDGTAVAVGAPYVATKVSATITLAEKLGEKIHVHKFKNKTRYRRKIGFRPLQSVLSITKIG